jgi:hypothetical protein
MMGWKGALGPLRFFHPRSPTPTNPFLNYRHLLHHFHDPFSHEQCYVEVQAVSVTLENDLSVISALDPLAGLKEHMEQVVRPALSLQITKP